MIGRLLCWLGQHRMPPGVSMEWSISWECHREKCRQICPGGIGRQRR